MKLSEQFHKLKIHLTKFKDSLYLYKFSSSNINDFIGANVYNISLKDNCYEAYGNKLAFNKLLNNENVKCDKYFIKKLFKFIKQRLLMFVLMLLICIALIYTKDSVNKIMFLNDDLYDARIVYYIQNNLKNKPFKKILNKDLRTLNKELKIKFPEYIYLNVFLDNHKLKIIGEKYDYHKIKEDELLKEYHCLNDCYITMINITKGTPLVKLNQIVKKDTLLVLDEDNVPSGYILGITIYKQDIKIKKVDYSVKYHDLKRIKNKLLINDSMITKFNNENIILKNKLSFGIFSIYELYEQTVFYETIDLSKEQALIYAVYEMYQKFNEQKVSDLENIIEYNIINEYEDKDNYYYTFLIKANINIVKTVYR